MVLLAGYRGTPAERFARFCADPDENGCILWTGWATTSGYGRFWVDGKRVQAHRWAYEQVYGPVPDDHDVDHVRDRGCRSKLCVNVSHLEAVTHRVNVLRGDSPAARQARQTHCRHGHEFSPENTYVGVRGDRRCRTCIREYDRRRYHERAARHA